MRRGFETATYMLTEKYVINTMLEMKGDIDEWCAMDNGW
jgi:hypothetical protein